MAPHFGPSIFLVLRVIALFFIDPEVISCFPEHAVVEPAISSVPVILSLFERSMLYVNQMEVGLPIRVAALSIPSKVSAKTALVEISPARKTEVFNFIIKVKRMLVRWVDDLTLSKSLKKFLLNLRLYWNFFQRKKTFKLNN
jgi:hypothetical protein